MSAPTIRDCIQAVSAETNVPPSLILHGDRSRAVARPRQVAMWLARQSTRKSLPEIGLAFHRHHTTVLHAIQTVDGLRRGDGELDALMRRVQARLVIGERSEDMGR